jgi:hypothetical protein
MSLVPLFALKTRFLLRRFSSFCAATKKRRRILCPSFSVTDFIPKFYPQTWKNERTVNNIWTLTYLFSSLVVCFGANICVKIVQMARFSRVARWYILKSNIPIWVNFGESCNRRCWYIYGRLVYITAVCEMLWPFYIVYCYLVYFTLATPRFLPIRDRCYDF